MVLHKQYKYRVSRQFHIVIYDWILWGVLGVRSRGMTPEVTQETGRRRTTSEGQYQSSHDNTPTVDSPDFAHNLALNPGGRPREVSIRQPLTLRSAVYQSS